VGEQSYCIDIDAVESIRGSDQVAPQRGPKGRLGWIGKDRRIPVYSMQARLDQALPGKQTLGAILVLENAQSPWALAVDQVSRVVEVRSSDVFALPRIVSRARGGLFQSVVSFGDSLVLLPRLEGLHPDARDVREDPLQGDPDDKPRRPSQQALKNHSAQRRIVVFEVPNHRGDEPRLSLGFSVKQVMEVRESEAPLPVPSSPSYLMGLIRWRDRPIPVIDIGNRLGMRPLRNALTGRFAVVRGTGDEDFCAVPATTNMGAETLPLPYHPSPRPLGVDDRLSLGLFERPDRALVLLPNLERVLA
jgi:chemotaxis signal transduction protein